MPIVYYWDWGFCFGFRGLGFSLSVCWANGMLALAQGHTWKLEAPPDVGSEVGSHGVGSALGEVRVAAVLL